MKQGSLIEVNKLSKVFSVREGFCRKRFLTAVDEVSFSLRPGETLALIGESGSGKTTIGRMILGLLKPTSGQILYKGEPVSAFKSAKVREFRRAVHAVFQDPNLSLNPRMKVQEIITEPLRNFTTAVDYRNEVDELLERVGLNRELGARYPHQCSGGQKQRIAIARALAVKPEVVVLDEPLSALDITVQTRIITLLKELKNLSGMSYLFITHDLRTVRTIADRVLVMYRGEVVEDANTKEFLNAPVHPHSKALLAAMPKLNITDL